jgi:lysophospholipase L1-like esterase
MTLGFDHFVRIALLPLLLAQALWVRRTAQLLPEPAGARSGEKGQGPGLRLLILGDSAAAGVGAQHQDQALAGQLVARLAKDFTVDWRLQARTGHTTAHTLATLAKITDPVDVVVISLGVNDTTRLISADRFAKRQAQLLQELTSRLGAKLVLVSAVPDLTLFPALPFPLNWVLGRHSQRLDRALQSVAARVPQAQHLKTEFTPDARLIASDGYHPSEEAYALWADSAARVICDQADRFI